MWTDIDNKLCRNFVFKDFSEAFAFITQVALISEKMDHHPTWHNTYNKVTIELTTHDKGNTITQKDLEMSQRIDKLI